MVQNQRYFIAGSGRTARHFAHYFHKLGLNFNQWDRSQPRELLQSRLAQSTHVLLLISDSAIESFYREHLHHYTGSVLHFSGALEIPGVESAHPLMTFAQDLYDLETYKKIPFVTTSKKPASKLLPGLPNSVHAISADKKAYYHALCVMSGNFTTLLWQKLSAGLKDLGLPDGVESVYRKQIFQNMAHDLSGALTGPIARHDLPTVIRNDQALRNDPYQQIYRAFLAVHYPEALSKLEGAT